LKNQLISGFYALCLLLFGPGQAAFAEATFHQLRDNGPVEKRINIVYVSAYYSSNEQSGFLVDAGRCLREMLFKQPYLEYNKYFNGFAIAIPYERSDYDNPPDDLSKTSHGSVVMEIDSLLQEFIPEYDIVVRITNDPESSGGIALGGIAYCTNSEYGPRIAVHEIGHSFGKLTDEYRKNTETPFYTQNMHIEVEGRNVTRQTKRDLIPWRSWIEDITPLPTPSSSDYSTLVGLFEIGVYPEATWYRPKWRCAMLSSYYDFCEVCREQLVKAIYDVISPIDSFSPEQRTITINPSESISLNVVPMKPKSHELSIQWMVDGHPEANAASTSFTVSKDQMGYGNHTIEAVVADPTYMVRDDPENLLSDSAKWDVLIKPPVSRVGNFPNPFNLETNIHFEIAENDFVTLRIYNLAGQLVRSLKNEWLESGSYRVKWDGRDSNGKTVPSGIYFCRIQAGGFSRTGKMVVLK
jgi:hypothetical protein